MQCTLVSNLGLCGGFFQVGDQILAIVLLLQTGEHHFGTFDVLLWGFEVVKKRFFPPKDTGVNVCRGVRVPRLGTRGTAEKTVKVWSLLGGTTL
jgi:hypothetical protein